MGGGRDAAHTYVISQVRVRTHSCTLGFVFRSLSLAPLMEGLVNRVIMILQIWLGAMNGRRAKAAPTVIHLSFKCGDYHKLCSPPRVLNLKSLPERQSRTRQVELTAVITAHNSGRSYLLLQKPFQPRCESLTIAPLQLRPSTRGKTAC